jgi:hypothetical protein
VRLFYYSVTTSMIVRHAKATRLVGRPKLLSAPHGYVGVCRIVIALGLGIVSGGARDDTISDLRESSTAVGMIQSFYKIS